MQHEDWYGCYAEGWGIRLIPESMAHPAKVSYKLAERIYARMLKEGWLKPGQVVLDMFAGVGGFAFHALLNSLNFIGIELEPRFLLLGQGGECDGTLCGAKEAHAPHHVVGNIELWNSQYAGKMPGWGTARILQGDSRFLRQVLQQAEADHGVMGVLSSPPFQGTYADDVRPFGGIKDETFYMKALSNYGNTPGQLGTMPAGQVDATISSPPFQSVVQHAGGPVQQQGGVMYSEYGEAEGQLGNLPAGAVEAAVSPPPYQTGGYHDGVFDTWGGDIGRESTSIAWSRLAKDSPDNGYGDHPDQLTGHGETFWSAAKLILQQVYSLLKPGGYAVFVCGDFVRQGQRVYFGKQWLTLCESIGFVPILWATAWKTETNGTQLDIFGGAQEKKTARLSFFRRLANAKNPANAIENEDVLFLRKPP